MPNYRRVRVGCGTWFFTVVTAHRRHVLASSASMEALRGSIAEVQRDQPFVIDAWVVLPDHMHAIWTLQDSDFSRRWARIKRGFTRRCGLPHVSLRGSDAGIWQRRFWEHLVRDDDDFARHMDYVHYNPVKHGHVARVIDWPWSTFHRCVRRGPNTPDWGEREPVVPGFDVGE